MAERPTATTAGSFRDPSGALFEKAGVLYRRVNATYRENYDRLIASGLYDALVEAGLLIPHEEVRGATEAPPEAYKILRPERVQFVSYPYEWCFGQLKDAALTTLQIQAAALDCGLSLKDASAYNIQFHRGRPILIDTLSFEQYRAGAPWAAYRQFCGHFLAPLALMAKRDVRLGLLLREYIDGLPLDLTSRLLPWHTRLQAGLLVHLHLHSRMQSRFAGEAVDRTRRTMSLAGLRGLIDNLQSTVTGLNWEPSGTTWGDYYQDTNYTPAAFDEKKRLVEEFIAAANPKNVWDLGANVGLFGRLAAARGRFCVAFDIDPAAVEKNYRRCRRDNEANLLPLCLDLTNPSPAIGWAHEERMSLAARGPADLVLALALIHHLAIANNLPLGRIAAFFAHIARALVVEFIPKKDSQTRRLLASREDIFRDYDEGHFRRAFEAYFTIERAQALAGSARTLYLMRRKSGAA